MNITLVTPYAGRSRSGNRNTAYRWAGMLRQLGHKVQVQVEWDGRPADLMLALHARRSHEAVRRFAGAFPEAPLILALTGTDLYRDIHQDASARLSLALATRLVVLQDRGLRELSPDYQTKTRVIYQSALPVKSAPKPVRYFRVCIVGHLREEKDPFRTVLALPHLPGQSKTRIIQIGGALSPEMAGQAHALMQREARYRWLGEMPRWQAMRKLAGSHVMVISSRMEGGANVICEAVMAGVPVLASDIPGNIGMLGEDYAGYYPCADERALADLLWRAESEAGFLDQLGRQCALRRELFMPRHETDGLEKLLAEFTSSPDAPGPRSRARTSA